MLYDPTEHRIRSFVTRAGRLSTAQERALNELGPQFLVAHKKEALDYEKTFGRKAPVILEIGFGMGGTTAHIAKLMPEKDFTACRSSRRGTARTVLEAWPAVNSGASA